MKQNCKRFYLYFQKHKIIHLICNMNVKIKKILMKGILTMHTQRKFFFFDIDGTLTNKNPGGDILPSTIKTLEKLKENGHIISIATGRDHLSALKFAHTANIHNVVSDGGNGIIINDEVKHIHPLNKEHCLQVIDECIEKNIGICIVSDFTGKWYSHNTRIYDQYQSQPYFKLTIIEDLDYHKVDNFYKVYVGIDANKEDTIVSLAKTNLPYVRFSPGHLEIEPDDKYQGILDMLSYYNGNEEDVIVFGDGKNDIKMMSKAHTSIAMGNAIDQVKEIATFVTKRNDDDGIEYACKHFGWID